MWIPMPALFETAKQYKDECVICGGPWHPATGQLVGNPMQVKVCGACFKNDIIPLIKDSMERDIRLSTRDKKEAAAQRDALRKSVGKKGLKAAKGSIPKATRISFYQHAGTGIVADKP